MSNQPSQTSIKTFQPEILTVAEKLQALISIANHLLSLTLQNTLPFIEQIQNKDIVMDENRNYIYVAAQSPSILIVQAKLNETEKKQMCFQAYKELCMRILEEHLDSSQKVSSFISVLEYVPHGQFGEFLRIWEEKYSPKKPNLETVPFSLYPFRSSRQKHQQEIRKESEVENLIQIQLETSPTPPQPPPAQILKKKPKIIGISPPSDFDNFNCKRMQEPVKQSPRQLQAVQQCKELRAEVARLRLQESKMIQRIKELERMKAEGYRQIQQSFQAERQMLRLENRKLRQYIVSNSLFLRSINKSKN